MIIIAKLVKKELAAEAHVHVWNTLHREQVDSIPVAQGWLNIYKSVNIIHHRDRLKHSSLGIVSRDTEMAFDEIQHGFRTNTLTKLGIGKTYSNTLKAVCNKPLITIPNWGNLKHFHSKSEYSFSPLLSNSTWSISWSNKTRKENKVLIRQQEAKLSPFLENVICRRLYRLHQKSPRADKYSQQSSRRKKHSTSLTIRCVKLKNLFYLAPVRITDINTC